MIEIVLRNCYGTKATVSSPVQHDGPYSFVSYLKNMLRRDTMGDMLTVLAFHLLTHCFVSIIDGRPGRRLSETRVAHNYALFTTMEQVVNRKVDGQDTPVTVKVPVVGAVLVFTGHTYVSAGNLSYFGCYSFERAI